MTYSQQRNVISRNETLRFMGRPAQLLYLGKGSELPNTNPTLNKKINNMRHRGLLLFSLFPYPSDNPLPHMCLRNAYEG
jgi:hypothetical protein